MLIALDEVSKAMAGRKIIDRLSLQIARGEHLLLLGPSGSGKTTLVNLVCGLLTPDAGSIRVAGEAIDDPRPGVRDDVRRRRIGIIFQTLRLVGALDVTANLLLAQRLAGRPRDRDRIEALLARLGLAHRSHARPRELSHGEAQRAAIARALVSEPDLLVADEPTSALDDSHAEAVGRLLIEQTDANGATLLVATHDARLKPLIGRSLVLEPLP
ncbi:ATP-binding cassette domain-containing protein [Sphingomonas sp. PL-96]|uniref:ATP-binding cassette domain-containing protein n=1 Tax=Sphingomonas sp. PL-96 TaxID=2887201 RepID=UPI001E610D48|nr:ATP-binding cassette domain-containing protein [Sphingomonas sp. PL-96]MCC2977102.1 ATP-binding cassette domain-containing protein [Sphingomonas sp. PL-96]